jgi:drug/metabolite transporter (DMT)-like permease
VDLSPLAFVGVRMAVAALTMALIYKASGGSFRITGREALHFFGLGVLGTTGYQLFFIHGIDLTTAGNSALIQAAVPVIVAAECHWLTKDRLRPVAWLGVLLSFLGLYLVVRGGPGGLDFRAESFRGDLLVLGAVACWGTYTALARPALLRHPPDKVSAFSILLGVVPLLVISWPEFAAQEWGRVPWTAWLIVAYSGVFSICVAYLLWGRAVRRVGSARTAVYSNLVPVIVLVLAAIILGEAVTWLQVGGAVVIFVGIALTRWRGLLLTRTTGPRSGPGRRW